MLATLILSLATYCITPEQSSFRINVNAGGLFGAFAHDHVIETKEIRGCADIDTDALQRSSVEVAFATAGLKVMDPSASAEERGKVQASMEQEVLQPGKYPEILFRSNSIENVSRSGTYRFSLKGPLSLHGVTHPVAIPVTMETLTSGDVRIRGRYTLKQSEFGIKPIRLGGGTIKVKDEVKIEFDLRLKAR